MSALVGYGSSDEDDEIQPEKPAKIARLDPREDDHTRMTNDNTSATNSATVAVNTTAAQPARTSTHAPNESLPAPGPSVPAATDVSTVNTPASQPLSPYSSERERIQELTMPTVPNFDIPDSPPPPPRNSEEAATLAASTKKFERFLELKKQGVHFNDRLQKSAALRNPSLLAKLMDFAGISEEESYGSTLPAELAVPTRWPRECYVEELVKENDRRERRRKEGRDKVDFVSASEGKSAFSSNANTPKKGNAADGSGKRSRFDQGK